MIMKYLAAEEIGRLLDKRCSLKEIEARRDRIEQEHQQASLEYEQMCLKLVERDREMEKAIRDMLQRGVEKNAIAKVVTPTLVNEAEHTLTSYREIAGQASNMTVKAAIESRIPEAERFVAWLQELLGLILKPIPPLDESKLTPLPDGPPQGFVSLDQARQLLKNRNAS
jgi:hypothetical protein